MVRVSKNLGCAVAAVLGAAITGCGSSDKTPAESPAETVASLVVFSPMYSAFDGMHTYTLPAMINPGALDQTGTDPVMAESVQWAVDAKMVSKDPYDAVPGAVLLTTLAAGNTVVTATAKTKSGRTVKGTSMLHITQGSPEDWTAGDARYNNNVMIDIMGIGMGMAPAAGAGGAPPAGAAGAGGGGAANPCGLPMGFDLRALVPANASCANCHNNSMGITVEHSPQQTAGYSDEQLEDIFSMGMKPNGVFTSTLLNNPFLMSNPTLQLCIYKELHTWDIADEVKKGIVLKLRSITPAPQPAIDLTRLMMMFRQGAPAAAGAPAPAADTATAGTGP